MDCSDLYCGIPCLITRCKETTQSLEHCSCVLKNFVWVDVRLDGA